MKLGKLAAGATALALSLALVPSVASADAPPSAETTASADTKNGFESRTEPPKLLYYSTTMTVSAARQGESGAARDLNELHYGDKVKVTFSKVNNPADFEYSPEKALVSYGVFKEEMNTSKDNSNNRESLTTAIAEKLQQPISITADTSFYFDIPCSLAQQKYYVSSNLLVVLRDADMSWVRGIESFPGNPESIYANVPFTINDPEGAAKCANNNDANPGTNPQPEATQNELDQKAKELQDKEYGDNLTKAALANRALVKDRYVSDIDKLLQQDAQKYAALEPYKKQISDALAEADTAIAAAQDPLSDSATKNAMAKFRRAYLDAWEQALKIQNPELAQQYLALQRLYYQAKTSGDSQLVNKVNEMERELNKAWPAWFSPESTAENQYSYMVMNTENKDLTAYAKTVKEQIATLKAALDKQGANSNNHDKKVEQKPVKKDSLPPTGAIALLATALAGTLVAAGGGITYLSRRSKQRS